jgi:hypothetical protein
LWHFDVRGRATLGSFVSEGADSFADGPTGRELVGPVERDPVNEARPLATRPDEVGTAPVVAERATLPATVAAASGGFILGVATFMLMRVLRRPEAARSVAKRRKKLLAKRRGEDIVASRSFLVDVHLLKR